MGTRSGQDKRIDEEAAPDGPLKGLEVEVLDEPRRTFLTTYRPIDRGETSRPGSSLLHERDYQKKLDPGVLAVEWMTLA